MTIRVGVAGYGLGGATFHGPVVQEVPGLELAAVATSKPEVYARPIIDHFELRDLFVDVYGSELDGVRGDKADLIGYLLSREHLERADTWMIGDRLHDIAGGHRNGLRTAGALWGYGGSAELEAAGADARFASMADLVAAFVRPPAPERG